MAQTQRFRRLKLFGKILLAGSLLTYLLLQVRRQEGFERLIGQEKDWSSISLGVLCILVAVTLSFVRWHILVRALELEFRLIDALRLGAIGFALNFVALGNVGGDLFKAIFIARNHPGRRAAAVATIVVDRTMGMFTYLVLATIALLWIDIGPGHPAWLQSLAQATFAATATGLLAFVAMLYLPGLTSDKLMQLVARLPLVGEILRQLLGAVQAYRYHKWQLLAAVGVSAVVDTVFVLSFYLVARGLPLQVPSLLEHYFVVPMALAAGSVPVTPSGLGTLELAVNKLYQVVPSSPEIMPGTGTLATLAHRVAMMIVGTIAVVFYLTQRGPMQREAKSQETRQE